MRAKRLAALLAGLVVGSVFVAGCTSTTVSVAPLLATYENKLITVVNIGEVDDEADNLLWTAVVAGEVDTTCDQSMADSLEQALMDLRLFQLVESSILDSQIKDRRLYFPDRMNAETALDLARKANLDGIVVVESHGKFGWAVLYLGSDFKATAKLIDVQTGKVVWSAQSTYGTWTILPVPLFGYSSTTAYSKMARSMASKLADSYFKAANPPAETDE